MHEKELHTLTKLFAFSFAFSFEKINGFIRIYPKRQNRFIHLANPDTGPLVCPFAHSLAYSFAGPALLALLARSAALICLLAPIQLHPHF